MIKLDQVIVVEGKYDKIKVGQIFDTEIITTDGFGIFKNDKKLEYMRRVAQKRGIIILTDSDGAGLVIRNHLKSVLNDENVYYAYIPQLEGKERRKAHPGKEGLLGVEGVSDDVIIKAVMSCGIKPAQEEQKERLTKGDMYDLGLSGGQGSAEKRKRLAKSLDLPDNISANSLLDALNILCTKDEIIKLLKSI